MEKCLGNNNPDVHYIKDILEYFLQNDKITGLYHLSIAADVGHKEVVYLYAIILLCRGMTDGGKNYLNQLKWDEDTVVVNTCCENIKTSLHGIRVARKRVYIISLRKMKPTNVWHLYDMNNLIALCKLHFESNKKEWWKLLSNVIEKSPTLETLILKDMISQL